MAKFNKGDKVRVIDRDEDVAYGTILTVKRGPEGDGAGGNYYFEETREIVLGDGLELVEKKTEASELTTKFNVGDVVVTLKECGWAKGVQGLMKAGAIGKVKAVNGDKLTVKFGKKQPMHEGASKYRKKFVVRTSEVRLATEAEAPTKRLTVGDYAKVIDNDSTHDLEIGDIVEITTDEHDHMPYKAVRVSDGKQSLWIYESDLKRADKPAPKPFADGDIVVITANTNRSRNAVGDIGKINGEVRGKSSVCVDVPGKPGGDDVNGNWTEQSEMRHATAEEIAQYEAAIKPKYVPQKGDIVVATELAPPMLGFDVGDIVKVTTTNSGGMCDIGITKMGVKTMKIGFTDADKIRKATPAEVAAYEKAVADASKPKLKAGDYVAFKRSIADTKAGKPYKIEYYGAKGKLAFKDDAGDWCSIERTGDYEIVDAPSPEKPTLKAGDFVKFTKYNSDEFSSSDITLGKAYQVITDRCGDLAFLDDDNDERNAPLDCPDCYEIIPADEAKVARKPGEFKKGDIIEIKTATGGYDSGELAIISKITGRNIWYENKRSKGGKGVDLEWHTFADFIELVAPVESLTK